MMEQKITIQRFALKIAEEKKLKPADVEAVLKEMFRECAVNLQNAGHSTIPGFADFTKTTDSETAIKFDVDKTLSETINAPFQSFPAVELSDDFIEEENEAAEEEKLPDVEEKGAEESVEEESVEEERINIIEDTGSDVEMTAEREEISETDDGAVPPPVPETPLPMETPPPFNHARGYETPSNYIIEQDEEVYVEQEEDAMPKRRKFIAGLICCIVICVVVAALTAVYCNLIN